MSTSKQGDPPNGSGGPGPFTEEEVAAATAPPSGDPELEEVDPAPIDQTDAEPETPFDRVVAHARRYSPRQIRNVLESVLFVAPAPMSVDQLFETTGIDRKKIADGLEALQGDRREGVSGIVLHEVAGGWQLRTAPESADAVKRFLKVKPQRLTRAALETLALVAYRQPVTRPEIEDVRGVDSGAVLKALLERRLIKIVGKKEEVGRPILYGTTREFLEFFTLRDLGSLPTLREFHELTEESREIVEKEAPPPAAGTIAELSDPEFKARLDASNAASEEALAKLESAMEQADTTSKTAATILDPPAPPPAEAPAGEAKPAEAPPAEAVPAQDAEPKPEPSEPAS